MYRCDWFVHAYEVDHFNQPGIWNVKFFLKMKSHMTTLFSILVKNCFSEEEAIEAAFEALDEKHISDV